MIQVNLFNKSQSRTQLQNQGYNNNNNTEKSCEIGQLRRTTGTTIVKVQEMHEKLVGFFVKFNFGEFQVLGKGGNLSFFFLVQEPALEMVYSSVGYMPVSFLPIKPLQNLPLAQQLSSKDRKPDFFHVVLKETHC